MDTKNDTVKKEPGNYKPEDIVVNQIILRAVDRTPKDIETWRTAHRSAEQIEHPQTIRLFDLYFDIELDGHLSGITQRRIDSVLNKQLKYVNKAGEKVDEMDDTINSLVFREIISILIKRKFWGRVGMEFIPGEQLEFDEVPVKHIKTNIKKITIEQSGEDGWNYEDMPNFWVLGKRFDFGLYLKCGYYALLKRGDISDWAQYIERYGIPPMVFKYDAYDIKTKTELTKTQEEAGSALSIMIPKQADFEIHPEGTANNSNGDLQDKFRQACNDEMSIIILTNTQTTTSSKGSGYAQAKVHSQQQLEITKSDMIEIELLLSSDQFQNILKSYALPVEDGGKFIFEQEFNLDDLTSRAEIDVQICKIVPVSDDYFYETYGIPKPENYDELRKKMDDAAIAAQQQPQLPAPASTQQKLKIKKLKPPKLSAEEKMNFLDKIRTTIADFFDPAHKD